MRSALKDTTQRYKSLTGFAIYAIACDISSMRYALRGVRGFISYRSCEAAISHLLFGKYIEFCTAKHIAKRYQRI